MKRKVIFTAILITAIVITGVAITYAQGKPSVLEQQRLYGVVTDAWVGLGPTQDPPFYTTHPSILVSNPDWQQSKTLERIVVSRGSSILLDEDMSGLVLGPHESWHTDFRMLGIDTPPFGSMWHYYVDIYWEGKGQPLTGYLGTLWLEVEDDGQGGIQAVNAIDTMEREMMNVGR